MKASRDQFPTLPEDLPENAHLNFDKRRDAYQVYTEKMVNGKVTRVSIGTLRTNGSFTYNKTYALEQELKKEKKKAASALRRLNAKADAEPKKRLFRHICGLTPLPTGGLGAVSEPSSRRA